MEGRGVDTEGRAVDMAGDQQRVRRGARFIHTRMRSGNEHFESYVQTA